LGFYGTGLEKKSSVIEVEILIQGDNTEVVKTSELLPPPSPPPVKKRIAKKTSTPAFDEKSTAPDSPQVTSAPETWEDILDRSSRRPLQGRELDASERYVMELRRILNQKKTYPALAKKLRQRGRVIVRFILREDGHLLKADVVEASPFESLNSAASELIKNIDGLKPFPEELKDRKFWAFRLPVDYDL
jgi:protein TonB